VDYVGVDQHSINDTGASTLVRYAEVHYAWQGTEHAVDLVSSGTPFADAPEDAVIPFRLHPADPEFLVHPDGDRPSAFWRSIPIVLAFLLGGLIILGVLISLF